MANSVCAHGIEADRMYLCARVFLSSSSLLSSKCLVNDGACVYFSLHFFFFFLSVSIFFRSVCACNIYCECAIVRAVKIRLMPNYIKPSKRQGSFARNRLLSFSRSFALTHIHIIPFNAFLWNINVKWNRMILSVL